MKIKFQIQLHDVNDIIKESIYHGLYASREIIIHFLELQVVFEASITKRGADRYSFEDAFSVKTRIQKAYISA
jgi:hypothetical protein